MYQTHFHLNDRPFAAAPNPEHYFPACSVEQAREVIALNVERAAGVTLLMGPVGSGKTLLCQLIANHFASEYPVCSLPGERIRDRSLLLQAILHRLGLPFRGDNEGQLRLTLTNHVTGPACPKGILMIVDEADRLPLELLEEIRVITNLVKDGQPRVRLVLAGAPRLEERVGHPQLESLNQRVVGRLHLENFSEEETAEYVKARITSCGGDSPSIFTDAALETVFRATAGVPRLINQVCDHALLMSAVGNANQLDGELIEEAWADLQQLPVPPGSFQDKTVASDEPDVVVEFGRLEDDDTMTAAYAQLDELHQVVATVNEEIENPPIEIAGDIQLEDTIGVEVAADGDIQLDDTIGIEIAGDIQLEDTIGTEVAADGDIQLDDSIGIEVAGDIQLEDTIGMEVAADGDIQLDDSIGIEIAGDIQLEDTIGMEVAADGDVQLDDTIEISSDFEAETEFVIGGNFDVEGLGEIEGETVEPNAEQNSGPTAIVEGFAGFDESHEGNGAWESEAQETQEDVKSDHVLAFEAPPTLSAFLDVPTASETEMVISGDDISLEEDVRDEAIDFAESEPPTVEPADGEFTQMTLEQAVNPFDEEFAEEEIVIQEFASPSKLARQGQEYVTSSYSRHLANQLSGAHPGLRMHLEDDLLPLAEESIDNGFQPLSAYIDDQVPCIDEEDGEVGTAEVTIRLEHDHFDPSSDPVLPESALVGSHGETSPTIGGDDLVEDTDLQAAGQLATPEVEISIEPAAAAKSTGPEAIIVMDAEVGPRPPRTKKKKVFRRLFSSMRRS